MKPKKPQRKTVYLPPEGFGIKGHCKTEKEECYKRLGEKSGYNQCHAQFTEWLRYAVAPLKKIETIEERMCNKHDHSLHVATDYFKAIQECLRRLEVNDDQ